jgi:hypothetical protein
MIDINIDEHEIHKIVLDNLKTKKPLSIIRIGDGELCALEYDYNKTLTDKFYISHTGRVYPKNQIIEISNNIRTAIQESDIIGITPSYLISQRPDSPWSITNNKIYEILYPNHGLKRYCDMNLHFKLTHNNLLDDILKSVNELYILTSRDVKDKLLKKYPNIKKIYFYKIPGEFKFEEEKTFEDFYPTIYNRIYSDFSKNDYSGKLLLFGGGFIGKNLGVKFSKSGGVSIDLGSVFDLFYGKLTRGEGKGSYSYIKSILE